MQGLLNTAFSLEATSYWLPMIWCLGAGLLLRGMPQRSLLIDG